MGLLDDAIREHMDLKRLRGADPSEVAREEQDVLGPVNLQEQAEPQAPEEDPADAKEIAPAAQDFGANVGQETAELDMRTVLDDEQSTEQSAEEASHLPGQEQREQQEHEGQQEQEQVEDVLEETPDFLRDTPEQERLWFEQQPPRDFDFDK